MFVFNFPTDSDDHVLYLTQMFKCLFVWLKLSPRGGGYSWEFLVEVCRPALQILTLFQIKIFDYSHLFSDLASHENLYPFSDPAPKTLCHHYLD